MTKNDDNSHGSTIIFSVVVVGLLVFSFVLLALADSFFSWRLMPELVERLAHEVLFRIVPME
jgi:hypothetical protein